MEYFTFKLGASNQEYLDKVLSSLLPHAQFDVSVAKVTVDRMFRTVPIEETYGINYIFFTLFKRMALVKMYMNDYGAILRRELLESALNAAVTEIIMREEFGAKQFFGEYGKTYNLDVPAEAFDAASFVFSEALNKYDELFSLEIPSVEGDIWLNMLRTAMEHDITAKAISLSGQVLTSGYNHDGILYKGATDARKLISLMAQDISSRTTIANADFTSRFTVEPVRSYEEFLSFRDRNKVQIRDLYYMGIDPIDQMFPIKSQDIVTIVGDEGTGKTRLSCGQVYQAVTQGLNVLMVCGESAKIKISAMLQATHLFALYGLNLSWDEIMDPSKIQTDDMQTLEDLTVKINSSAKDFHENKDFGSVCYQQAACYETFEEDIRQTIDAYGIDLVVIDHVLTLSSNGEITPLGRLQTKQARVTFLYQCEDVLVKECNIAFLNISHPSVDTSKDIKAGKKPGARSGAESSESSRYSTLICVLVSTDSLKKQDMIVMYVTKSRDSAPIIEPIVLQRCGFACQHNYDPRIQHFASNDVSEFSQEDIEALYKD